MNKKFIFTLGILLLQSNANALITLIQEGSPVTILVDSHSGATLELPMPVKMVPIMPKYFEIKAHKNDNGQSQEKIQSDDVTVFTISPGSKKQDSATFLLSNGKSFQVNLIPVETVQDPFYQLKFSKKDSNSSYASNSKFFLSDEKNMMISMIKDDNRFGVKKTLQELKIKEYPELDFKILRTYSSNGLEGYLIKVQNKSERVIQINPTVLKIGNPNRIMMIQNDHDILDSCERNSDPNPTGTGCFSILRIIVRSKSNNLIGLSVLNDSKIPFLVEKNEVKNK